MIINSSIFHRNPFLSAALDAVYVATIRVFDWVISHLTGSFKAKKILIQRRDGKVSGGTMVKKDGKYMLYSVPDGYFVCGNVIPDELKREFDITPYNSRDEKYVCFEPDQEFENELRRRYNL